MSTTLPDWLNRGMITVCGWAPRLKSRVQSKKGSPRLGMGAGLIIIMRTVDEESGKLGCQRK